MKLYEEAMDLCDRVVCPINAGPVVFHYDKRLPPATPRVSSFDSLYYKQESFQGKIFVRVTASDESGVLLMCLEVNFGIGLQSVGVVT